MSEIRVDNITNEAGTGAPEITDHYKKSNIIGTVSESSGVPTGAIIERGSNANGEYVKYADGTMICWVVRFNLSRRAGSIMGDDWNFPANFINTDISTFVDNTGPVGTGVVIITSSDRRDRSTATRVRNTSSAVLAVFSEGNFDSEYIAPVNAKAIGRWF